MYGVLHTYDAQPKCLVRGMHRSDWRVVCLRVVCDALIG
jgi:hypothetical protein